MYRRRKEGKVIYTSPGPEVICTSKSGKNPSQGKQSKPVRVSISEAFNIEVITQKRASFQSNGFTVKKIKHTKNTKKNKLGQTRQRQGSQLVCSYF